MTLPDALALGRQAGAKLPPDQQILLVGVEAADILTFSEQLTPAVQAAVPCAVRAALEALDFLTGGT